MSKTETIDLSEETVETKKTTTPPGTPKKLSRGKKFLQWVLLLAILAGAYWYYTVNPVLYHNITRDAKEGSVMLFHMGKDAIMGEETPVPIAQPPVTFQSTDSDLLLEEEAVVAAIYLLIVLPLHTKCQKDQTHLIFQ